jgi:lysyl-tRNA synthetase class 1
LPISFAMLLNLASVVNAEEPDVLWAFIKRYAPEATPDAMPLLAELVDHALAYYRDFVKPAKAYRLPSDEERRGLEELASFLDGFEIAYGEHEAEVEAAAKIQEEVYEIGKRHGFADNLRDWFKALYEILLGQSAGPRFGSFVAFYGPAETKALIEQVLKGEELGKPAA